MGERWTISINIWGFEQREKKKNNPEESNRNIKDIIRNKASLVTQSVKNLPAVPETWVQSLG